MRFLQLMIVNAETVIVLMLDVKKFFLRSRVAVF